MAMVDIMSLRKCSFTQQVKRQTEENICTMRYKLYKQACNTKSIVNKIKHQAWLKYFSNDDQTSAHDIDAKSSKSTISIACKVVHQ